jgi:hypothetical protein
MGQWLEVRFINISAVPKASVIYVTDEPGGPALNPTSRRATDKAKSNPQILHLERTVPFASIVTNLF